jgi:creatinine amidohydrolase
MHYGDLRWIDVDAADRENLVVVCPLGSLEQHGHHLPLLTDTYLVTAVADRVHERLADRICLLPALWLGASDHHLDFPGTVSASNTLYTAIIKDVLRSLVRGGWRRIFFLNGHGGNVAPGETAITAAANACDRCDAALIALSSYWTIAAPAMNPAAHGMHSPTLTHACEYETSMMLHVRGQVVKMDAARGTGDEPASHPTVRLAGRFHRKTETGALGRPELATAAKGRSLLEAIAAEVAATIDDFSRWPLPTIQKPARRGDATH